MNNNDNELKDEVIICEGCGQEFFFTVGEQKFYAEHNFIKPKRCKSCREARKQQI